MSAVTLEIAIRKFYFKPAASWTELVTVIGRLLPFLCALSPLLDRLCLAALLFAEKHTQQ